MSNMKQLKRMIWNWISQRSLKRLIKEADRLHNLTGKQYYVIPVENWRRGEYVIVNNEAHKAYNKQAKKLGKPQFNFKQLAEIAVYKTKVGSL